MATRTCPQCGTEIAENASFCGRCGTVNPTAGPAAAPPARNLQTMLGGVGFAGQPDAGPSDASHPAPAPGRIPPGGTMIGISAKDFLPETTPPLAAQSGLTQPLAAHSPAAEAPAPPADNRTMIGVARPGIAPEAPPATVPPTRGRLGTMLGVAMPGIAPTRPTDPDPYPPVHAHHGQAAHAHASPAHAHAPAAAIPPIVPAPPPLVDEPLPAAPVLAKRSGLPLALVAGGVALLVAAAGIAVYFFWKGGPPLVVKPRLGASGNEQLHLTCPTCPDGTTASLGGASASFKGNEASVELSSPLKLGENPLEIRLDRPAMGRDETVKAAIVVPYRIKVDLSNLSGSASPAASPTGSASPGASVPPEPIVVRVETIPGTTAKVDGRDVALDAEGRGAQVIDVRAETEGPSDEGKIIDKSIPYEITPKGAATERGTLTARVGVVPLHIDAPGSHVVTDGDRFVVAGRTAKGANVTVNGRAIGTGTGIFSETFELPRAIGETAVEIRAAAPQGAPRTARFSIRRVAHLEAEAKAFEAGHPVGYDAVSSNIEAHVGKAFAAEGEVRQSRTVNHQTVAIVDNRRGCAKHPCIVRIVYGGDLDLKPKEIVRAYGRVTRAFSANEPGSPAPGGKPIPEMEADFVLRGKAR